MTKVVCDNCKTGEGRTISFEVNHWLGHVGDFEYEFEYVDICFPCLVEKIEVFLQNEPADTKGRFINVLAGKKSKVA